MEEKKKKKHIVLYFFAFVLILGGLGSLTDEYVFGSIAIFCGLLCLPQVRDLVDFKHKNLVFNIIVFLVFGFSSNFLH